MADTTITGLPNATTPLSGAERVPMDQSGTTKDATTQDIANLAPATDLAYTAATRVLASSTGTDATLPLATTTDAGLQSAADKTKLDGITVDSATVVRKLVRNNSGVAIAKGQPVYQTGSSGTTITVALADASTEATAAQTLGLAQEAIADNATGWVIAVGELSGINTATLTEGQIVWLSETTGGLTTTRPTQPAHGVVLGYCVKQSSGTSGIIYVKVDNGLELDELHDVLITSPATGQVLRRAADGLWKNHTLTAADVGAATTAQGALADTAIQPGNAALTDAREWSAETISQAEAEAGSAPTRRAFTAQRVRQAIAAWWAGVSTAAGRALVEAVDAAAQRTTLGLGNSATRNVGTTAGTVAAGDDARFATGGVTLGASVTDIFDLAGQVLGADDPGADRILFWDDSAGKLTHLATDSALLIDGTTLRALSTLVIPLTGEASNLTVSTLLTVPWWPETRVLTSLPTWMLNTAATGSAVVLDIRVQGASIYSTPPSISSGATVAVSPGVFSTTFVNGGSLIAQGSTVTFHCVQIGATTPGVGAKVTMPSRRAS